MEGTLNMLEMELLEKAFNFFLVHFETIITVGVTIIGFVVTYFMTKKNFKDEVIKNKLAINADAIKELPYQICQMMNRIEPKNGEAPLTAKDFSEILSKVLSYGSKDAVAIAVHMQQILYGNAENQNLDTAWEILASYSLLITQIKYDLTSEIVSPESWFQLKIKDYSAHRSEIVAKLNKIIEELNLNNSFVIK